MLTIRTSRVSTVKAVFCLAVVLVALYGFAIMPAYEWAAAVAQGHTAAPAARPAATAKS